MEIHIKIYGLDTMEVKASGRLDLDNAVEYGTKIKNSIEDSDEKIQKLILDFEEITFLSSFGLKVILELYKVMESQGEMQLINVSEEMLKSFKMVGFDKFLKINQ